MTPLIAAFFLFGIATVVDGDTLDVGGKRVRLWGIDAPEAGTVAGDAATAWLVEHIHGRRVACEGRAYDRWGRAVALCRWRGLDIGLSLVEAGHAQDWPKYSGGYYAKEK